VPTFKELIAEMGRGYLDPNRPHEIIGPETLKRAIEGLSVSFDDLPVRLALGEYSRRSLFDLTPFRTSPLWKMPDGFVFCVDAALLLERLGPHVFWTVMNSFDTSERRRAFTRSWGQGFESYVLDALSMVFRGKKWTFVGNVLDEASSEEWADAVATRDGVAVVVECKGTFIKSADKYSGIPGRFLRGLTKKFGNVAHGGIYQLVRAISRKWFRNEAKPNVAGLDTVGEVFPIIVVQDPIFNCGPVVRVLSDRFDRAIERARRRCPKVKTRVWPLTVMTADDLDRTVAIVESTGQRLDSILKRFHRSYPSRAVCLSEFFMESASQDFGFRAPATEMIRLRFKKTTDAALERFRASEYGARPEPV
jgi:hypothetical protein